MLSSLCRSAIRQELKEINLTPIFWFPKTIILGINLAWPYLVFCPSFSDYKKVGVGTTKRNSTRFTWGEYDYTSYYYVPEKSPYTLP